MVKKNPFTTSSQEKNTLQEAACHCQSLQSREDFTRANTEASPQGGKQGQIKICQTKKHLKSQTTPRKAFLDG